MRILVNGSNLRVGGGLQMADAIARELREFEKHQFVVVLPKALKGTVEEVIGYDNVKEAVCYDLPKSLMVILTGRDRVMDSLVKKHGIEAVLTVFGPSKWKPKVRHLCGFAMGHIVLDDSPYWGTLSRAALIKARVRNRLMLWNFRRTAREFWCENEFIAQRLREKLPGSRLTIATNSCNPIFEDKGRWQKGVKLPAFEGMTVLTVSANYPHKNLRIFIEAMRRLKEVRPEAAVRCVLTVKPEEYGPMPEVLMGRILLIGPVAIDVLPGLYSQAQVMALPTLMECFSASWVEAMRMGLPIITTDLECSRSICGDAALYFEPLNAESLAKKILELYDSEDLQRRMIEAGRRRLEVFDTAEERAAKLIRALEGNS